jgi:hypothetical protein
MKNLSRFAAVLMAAALCSSQLVHAQGWPGIFNPLQIRTLHLELEPEDWDTIRFDT